MKNFSEKTIEKIAIPMIESAVCHCDKLKGARMMIADQLRKKLNEITHFNKDVPIIMVFQKLLNDFVNFSDEDFDRLCELMLKKKTVNEKKSVAANSIYQIPSRVLASDFMNNLFLNYDSFLMNNETIIQNDNEKEGKVSDDKQKQKGDVEQEDREYFSKLMDLYQKALITEKENKTVFVEYLISINEQKYAKDIEALQEEVYMILFKEES